MFKSKSVTRPPHANPASSRSSRWCATLMLMMLPLTASAWEPTTNIELIPPGGPGTSMDRTMRLMDQVWKTHSLVDTKVTILNKPGGGQSVAWSYLNRHEGNSHYLSVTSPSLLIRRITGQSDLHYDRDVVPIALLFDDYSAIVVREDSPLKSGQDLINRLKADPKSLSIAISPGRGGPNHLALGLALHKAGVNINELNLVIFPGSSKAVTAVLGGHVDLSASPTSTALKHLTAGKARVLAISSPEPLGGAYEGIPTWSEQGIDAVFANWRMIIAPKGTPADQVAFWDGVLEATTKQPEWSDGVRNNNWTPNYKSAGEVRDFLNDQDAEMQEVLGVLGLAK